MFARLCKSWHAIAFAYHRNNGRLKITSGIQTSLIFWKNNDETQFSGIFKIEYP